MLYPEAAGGIILPAAFFFPSRLSPDPGQCLPVTFTLCSPSALLNFDQLNP